MIIQVRKTVTKKTETDLNRRHTINKLGTTVISSFVSVRGLFRVHGSLYCILLRALYPK